MTNPKTKKPLNTMAPLSTTRKHKEQLHSYILEDIKAFAAMSDEEKEELANQEPEAYLDSSDRLTVWMNERMYPKQINGATVNHDAIGRVEYKMIYNEIGQEMGLKITLNENEDRDLFLGGFFYKLPYGIIKKNRTGIGATTLELRSPRHSIIVVPTKALAAGKTKESKIGEGKYKYLYVGSPVENLADMPNIGDYLNDKEIEYKKIVVVADSLPKVIDAINSVGINVYEDYYLMIDEIDTCQADSTYRPKLEAVVDYYFCFIRQNRCMVSATVQKFSNPQINNEPVIEIEYLEPQRREIELVNTDNPNAIAKELIERLFDETPDKIVIAYNKVQFIRQVIQNLKAECQAECGILCSTQSMHKAGQFYTEINDGHLQKRITFMTCSYFSGVDIRDRFHLISISNATHIYTLLSPSQFMQIAGRCRHEDGVISETIIYSIVNDHVINDTPLEEEKDALIDFANDMAELINKAQQLREKHKHYLNARFADIEQEILKRTKKSYFQSTNVNLVRQDSCTRIFIPAYFVIDSIYESLRLRHELYTVPNVLFEKLRADNIITGCSTQNRKITEEQEANNKLVNEEYKVIEKESVQEFSELLASLYEADELNDYTLKKQLQVTKNRDIRKWLERFIRLNHYVPSNRLIQDIDKIVADEQTFRGYNNAVIFWALEEDHHFKSDLKGKFPIGDDFCNEDVKRKITDLYDTNLSKQFDSNISAALLGEYVQTERVKTHDGGSYRVVSYNKHNFEGEPKCRLTGRGNWAELLLFSSGIKDI